MRRTLLLLFILCSSLTYAATITAVNSNAEWTNPSIWDINKVPENGDVVIIPAGHTITLKADIYNRKFPTLKIVVYGKLVLIENARLDLSNQSLIELLDSGEIESTSTGYEMITIGSVVKFRGGFDASPLQGSASASSKTASSPNGFRNDFVPESLNFLEMNFQTDVKDVVFNISAIADNAGDILVMEKKNKNEWSEISTLRPSKAGAVQEYILVDRSKHSAPSYHRLKMTTSDNLHSNSSRALTVETITDNSSSDALQFSANKGDKIEVFNESGTLVKTISCKIKGIQNVELSNLSQGIYIIILLQQNAEMKSDRFVKHN